MIKLDSGLSSVSSQELQQQLSRPGAAVSAAMDLMKATLWAADAHGGVSAAAAAALTQAYPQQTIVAAFGHLRRLALVNPGTARRPYQLTDRAKTPLQASRAFLELVTQP